MKYVYETTKEWKYTLIDCFGNHIKTNEELFFTDVGYDRKACPMEWETPNKQVFYLNGIIVGYRER